MLLQIQKTNLPATVSCIFLKNSNEKIKVEFEDPILEYKFSRNEMTCKAVLKAPCAGIASLNVSVGSEITSDSCIGVIECSHNVQFRDLCTICGAIIETSKKATLSITHDAFGILVSQNEAERLDKENAKRLQLERKLSLILDLDQTILHATVDPVVGEWLNTPAFSEATTDIFSFSLDGNPIVYYIKLRPGIYEFLESISKLYEFHVYTMGTRNYANAVANIIDPSGKYFKTRILSRDESGSFTSKSLSRLFPCDHSMVVVVDDRGDVWDWSKNLWRVKPYNFFKTGDINEPGSQNNSHNTVGLKIPTICTDKQLEHVQKCLDAIHSQFFNELEQGSKGATFLMLANVQSIMTGMKRSVFSNVEIVFTGIIPTGIDPQTHEAWKSAEHFGAKCSSTCLSTTTHIVAAKDGTEKIYWGRRHGCKIVTVEWLYDSCHAWKLMNENDYQLKPAITTNILSHLAQDDWLYMDKEVDEALDEEDDEENLEWRSLDDEINDAVENSL